MRVVQVLAVLSAVSVATGCTDRVKGDPVRGEKIHEVCLECHGTSLYSTPDRKVGSLSGLHKEVTRWGDYYNPALSEQDVDDVTAYLNTHFYKF
jgi:mono/diheme cytochrome c family protein